jgi:hypothetical protein
MPTLRLILILTIGLTLAACASRNFESDKSNPYYHEGKVSGYPVTNITTSSPNASDSALTAIVTGISLAANRDYYRSQAITGKCICSSGVANSMEIPCPELDVAIFDVKGKELSRTTTTGGEFAFRVPKGQPYHVNVVHKHFRLQTSARDLHLGDDVILRLVPKDK